MQIDLQEERVVIMKNRKLLLILALVMSFAMAIGGTLAYLSDTDADVNVMTLGSVHIVQNEQQRVDDEENQQELEEFEQKQGLYPAVYEGTSIPYAPEDEWIVAGDPAWKVVEDNVNVIDKIVTVTNTGKSDAYVRTFFAFESVQDPAADGDYVHAVINDNVTKPGELTAWTWLPGTYEIDGSYYQIGYVTYEKPVAAGATTIPSLKQIYMDKAADNEYVETFGDEYQVLVLSQAVQTQGFDSAEAALSEAFPFGDDTGATVVEWFETATIGSPGDKWKDNNPPVTDVKLVTNLDELKAALAEGGYIRLANDIVMDNMIKIADGVEVTLDLNGKTITFDRSSQFNAGNPLFYPLTGSKMTITGNGTVDLEDNYDTALVYPAGEVVIENGTFIKDRVPEGTSPDDVQTLFMGVKSVGSSIVIKDGYFDGGYYDANAGKAFSETEADVNNRGKAADKNAYRTAVKNNVSLLINLSWSSAAGTQDFRIYGGTFVGANPAWGDEGCAMPITPDYLRPWSYYQGMFLEGQTMHDDKIVLPDGYAITEGTTADGRPTFTVAYSK